MADAGVPGVGTVYPLVFTIQIPVQGCSYSAGVEFRGGAVVTVEQDDDGTVFLAHGLKPGGVAGLGDTLLEAYLDLREKIEFALYDIAETASDLSAFRGDVAEFFHDADDWARDAFEAARREVAAGNVPSDLPTKKNPALRHSVTEFAQPLSTNNPNPPTMLLAA